MQVVPLLLQRPQVRLQPSLRLLVAHGEELPADLQSVDEAALVPLEQQLSVLRRRKQEEKEKEGGNESEDVGKVWSLIASLTIN